MRSMYFRPLNQQIPGLTDPNFIQAEGRSLYINSITLNFQTPPQDLDAMVRRTLANIDPNLTVIDLHSLDYQVAGNFTEERLISRLTALFGLLALVLASVGLYGITSYQVARRTSEIGLRMALGARRRQGRPNGLARRVYSGWPGSGHRHSRRTSRCAFHGRPALRCEHLRSPHPGRRGNRPRCMRGGRRVCSCAQGRKYRTNVGAAHR